VTYAPDDLLAVIRYLAGRGAPWASLGCVGDASHGTAGYHIGGDIVDWDDYSRAESPRDRSVTTSAASAIDFAGTVWWRPLTLWLVDQCRAGAPGTEDIREIIYTPDGETVRRWDRLGFRTGGDDSHLWHTHISFFRDSEGHRSSFLALLRRYFEPTPIILTVTEDDDMPQPQLIQDGFGIDERGDRIDGAPFTPLGYDIVSGGLAKNGPLWLVLFTDPWGRNSVAKLRLCSTNGKGWGRPDAVVLGVKEGWVRSIRLTDGDFGTSVARVKQSAADTNDSWPISYFLRYGPTGQ
jgi:hypothetical protein